jgi:NADH-quinone oxidoreductase subunit E
MDSGPGRRDAGPPVRREFSEAARKRIAWLSTRYPSQEALLLPVLRIAEEEFGNIDAGAVECVARELNLAPGHVYGVLTFYTHFRREGDGKFVIQVCSTISCALRGCREIARHLEERLGIQPGGTTPDGRFTLKKVECLGGCDKAPVLQINDEYHENLTPERIDAILDALK